MMHSSGTAHRTHSSIVGVKLDQRAAHNLIKKKELYYFHRVLENSERSFSCYSWLLKQKNVDIYLLIDFMIAHSNKSKANSIDDDYLGLGIRKE
ncbi:unnamed protein product [Rotaria sp. Silwood1]|nr:unnamed protein product [Rotaria sp. Silwood1]CAF3496436.1 unnamed protein product [Rotaria sp. Silwood1]